MWDGVNLVSIIPHGQNVLRGHGGSQVRRLELRFWCSSRKCPRTCPLLRLRISHLKDHGISRDHVSSIRGRYAALHRSSIPGSVEMEALAQCVSALTFWFLDNGLQLNSSKSEAMILGSRQGLSRMEPVGSLVIGDDRVEVRDDIKILGVHLDPTVSMNAQVKAVIKASNFHIRALRHVRRGLTLESTKMIALGLVTSRLDYCNSLLYGTSKTNTAKLQRVQKRSRASCASSSMEFQLQTIAQTATLAPSPAEDNFQDSTHHIQRAIFGTAILSPQSAGQLHTITEPEVRGTASPPSSIPKIGCRQTQLLLRRADHLEQSQLINKGGYLNRNIQDTPQDRTVFLGLSMNTHRPPPCIRIVLGQ